MKSMKKWTLVLVASLPLLACGDDGAPGEEGSTSDDDDTDSADPTTNPSTTVNPSTTLDPSTTGPTTTEPTTDMTATEPTTETTTGDTETTGEPTTSDTEMATTTGLLECADEDLGTGAPVTVMGNNSGAGDDLAPTCAAADTEEYVYQYTTDEAGIYNFDTLDTEYDSVLAIYDGCGGTEIACNEDAASFIAASQIVTTLEADTTYLVAVDGFQVPGAYTLSVDYLGTESLPDAACDALGAAPTACMTEGGATETYGGTLQCGDFFYYDIFEIDVAVGDCVHALVDNIDPVAGATGDDAADPRMLIIDPDGTGSLFDDEATCTDPAFTGSDCPEANVVANASGTMLIMVATYGGEDCPNDSPYSLDIAVNGTDVDLSGGPAMDDRLGVCV